MTESIFSHALSNLTNASHTPDPYCQTDVPQEILHNPDIIYNGFGSSWTESVSFPDAGSIGQQYEQVPPWPGRSDSLMGIPHIDPPGRGWVAPWTPGFGTNGALEPDLGIAEDYQRPQSRIRHEGMQSPIFKSTGGGGRLLKFVFGCNNVKPWQVPIYSNNEQVTSDPILSNRRESSPQTKKGRLQILWPANTHAKRMHVSNPHHCPLCTQTFKRRDNIKPHVRRKHRHQYSSMYTMSHSTAVQSSPASATRHSSPCDKSSPPQENEYERMPPSTNTLDAEQETQTPVMPQWDIICPEESILPQHASTDSVVLKDPDPPDGSKRRSTQHLSTKDDESQRSFACPFQKRHPYYYQKCFKLSLQRIKDVKQHIFRCHTNPEYYCARCYDVFDTATARDEHSRQRECKKLESPCLPQFEGITEDQKKQLSEKSPRAMDLEEQWLKIWGILFPDASESPPRSVYLGSCLEEIVPLLRKQWECQRPGIVSHLVEVEPQQLSCAMNYGMDLFLKSLESPESDMVGDGRSERPSISVKC